MIPVRSGRTLRHPAFLYGHVTTSPAGGGTHSEETGRTTWRLRFSPLEAGTYRITLRAEDASGSVEVAAGSFTATPPVRKGFIRVSRRDPPYFEFANGELYFRIWPPPRSGAAGSWNSGATLALTPTWTMPPASRWRAAERASVMLPRCEVAGSVCLKSSMTRCRPAFSTHMNVIWCFSIRAAGLGVSSGLWSFRRMM
jgi:hypothetical protein